MPTIYVIGLYEIVKELDISYIKDESSRLFCIRCIQRDYMGVLLCIKTHDVGIFSVAIILIKANCTYYYDIYNTSK